MINEDTLNNMDLPKANYYEHLETLSEQNFEILFDPDKFQLCTTDKRDKGLDITYEIIQRANHTGFRFIVQLKSTKSIKKNKVDGSLSFQLKSANINYLLNSHYPAFYVLYELNTKLFYYESVTEFLKVLLKKDNNWENQKSHTLRFNKELVPDGITEMFQTALKNGLVQRNLKQSATKISVSTNKNDRISFDSDLNFTDDSYIRRMIEVLGFELMNEGKWKDILFVHKKASGNVASSALYNLILGIANYYGGSRWDAISFFKKAINLKPELDREMEMHLMYFDNMAKYSIGLIEEDEYNKNMLSLENSEIVGLYVKLEKAKANYIESINTQVGENYDQLVEDMKEIINHPDADENVKLTAKCELLLLWGFKNNGDYLSANALLNSMEAIAGPNIESRKSLVSKTINDRASWKQYVDEVIAEAIEQKNDFAYFTALTNEVKISYQFDVYLSTVYDVKQIPGQGKNEKPDKRPMLDDMLRKIGRAGRYFNQIHHIENTIAAYSTMFELFHYIDDSVNANKILLPLEKLIDTHDLKDHKIKLTQLKKGGTTHETFKSWINRILGDSEAKKKEYDKMKEEMMRMDEEERKIKDKPKHGNLHIQLFPIGYFQFPKDQKKTVYKILSVGKEGRKIFDKMFEMVIPIANIYYSLITQEGYVDGKLADRGIESWSNIYRIRKEFYESKFYRFEDIPGI